MATRTRDSSQLLGSRRSASAPSQINRHGESLLESLTSADTTPRLVTVETGAQVKRRAGRYKNIEAVAELEAIRERLADGSNGP